MQKYAVALMVLAAAFAGCARAQGFKFSNEDPAVKAQAAEQSARRARVEMQLSSPCRQRIKNQKIMVLIGEERNGVISANQTEFGSLFDAVNTRLRALGLRTYTREEIQRQIRQAEIDATFSGDIGATTSAEKKMAARYVLRGLIATTITRNPLVNVNQVGIRMHFVLSGTDGRTISKADAKDESYAGQDVLGMALTLINERADEVVAQLYGDYCRKAGYR